MVRWALTIQQFSFTIKHRAGKTHGNAEALSRRPQFPTVAAIKTVNNNGFQANCIHNLQHQGVNLADLIAYLKSDELPANNKLASSLLLIVDDFFSEDDITGHKETSPFLQLVVPDGLKFQIINLFMVFFTIFNEGNPSGTTFKLHEKCRKIVFSRRHCSKFSEKYRVLCINL